jgi:uncharacterized C2H2 Zn-finger protein
MLNNIETFKKILKNVHCVKSVDEAVTAVIKKLMVCPFCSEYFIDPPALTEHIKKDHSDRLERKTIKVHAHEVDEDAETIYICPHCHFAVDNNCPSPTSSIVDHIVKHTASIDPTAKISYKISSDKKLIRKYVNGKVENKLFCCSFCTDMFSDRELLLRHISFKHSGVDPENVPYETMKLIMECAKDFPTGKKAKIKYKPTSYSF